MSNDQVIRGLRRSWECLLLKRAHHDQRFWHGVHVGSNLPLCHERSTGISAAQATETFTDEN
jgi:hypothetical protein